MNIIKNYITNPINRPQKQIKKIEGIIIHWIGVRQEKASVIRNNYENAKEGAGTQYIIGYDGEIIQTMPENEVAWHIGANSYTALKKQLVGNANPNYYFVGIECCINNNPLDNESKLIPKDYDNVNKYPNMGKPSEIQETNLIEFVADFCKRNKLNPLTQIYLHNDITGKKCHVWYLNHKDKFLEFKNKVAIKMNIEIPNIPSQKKGVVVASALNVRNNPSVSAKKIDLLKNDDTVIIYEELDGWYRIGGQWVSKDYIKEVK